MANFISNPPPAGDVIVVPTPNPGDITTLATVVKDGAGDKFLADDNTYKSAGEAPGFVSSSTNSVDNGIVSIASLSISFLHIKLIYSRGVKNKSDNHLLFEADTDTLLTL